jgi:hypothetical protein
MKCLKATAAIGNPSGKSFAQDALLESSVSVNAITGINRSCNRVDRLMD